jgi:hypothetical protein
MDVSPKFARVRFGAAVALYTFWIAALVALAVVSGARPGDRQPRTTPAPAAATSGSEAPKN